MDDALYIWLKNNLSKWHDLSVSILYNGKLHCIELERLFKIKHFWYAYHKYGFSLKEIIDMAIVYLLKGISLKDGICVRLINYPFDEFSLIKGGGILSYSIKDHHLLHAYSVFYASPYPQSAILTIDYSWERVLSDSTTENESQVMWYAKGNSIKRIYSLKCTNNFEKIWIGMVYSIFSQLIWLEEGSVMGLSSYWNISRFSHIKLFDIHWCDVFLSKKITNNIHIDKFSQINQIQCLLVDYIKTIYWVVEEDYLHSNIDVSGSIFADIAAHLQSEVEKAVVYLANQLYKKTKSENLCLAWWVALNILMNTELIKQTPFKNIFVQPAANDGWLSLWSVYYWYYSLGWNTKKIPFVESWLWNEYTNEEIKKELMNYSKFITFNYPSNLFWITSQLLSEWNIIGWFQWKSEFWPRALWFRSILADPRSITLRNKVNLIKLRQQWRPLAPVILEEKVWEYFKLGIKNPYMSFSSEVIKERQNKIPWATHIDWTARYQTVSKKENPKYYRLLKDFFIITGVPVLINTSFNVSKQPIVESPRDAIETFISTDIDYLVIGDYLVSKKIKVDDLLFNSSIANLNFVFKKEKLKNAYLLFWNNLNTLFFWDINNSIFIFTEESSYSFWIKIHDTYHQIKISILTQNNIGWYFFKYKDLWLEVIIWSNYKEVFSLEFLDLLNSMTEKIKTHYTKIVLTYCFK